MMKLIKLLVAILSCLALWKSSANIFEVRGHNSIYWVYYQSVSRLADHDFLCEYTKLDRVVDEVKTYHFIQHSHTDPGWIYNMAYYEKTIPTRSSPRLLAT